MIQIRYRPKGAIAFFADRGAPTAYEEIWTGALVMAATEYATGRLEPTNVLDRFEPNAFATHNYSQRGDKYQAQQQKLNGSITPFRSPRNPLNFQKVADALLRPSLGSTLALIKDMEKQNRPHMRDIITKPGIGWRVRVTGKRKKVMKITWPGAKVLNRVPFAAKEWRDLRRGGAYRAIMARANYLVKQAVEKRVEQAPRLAA